MTRGLRGKLLVSTWVTVSVTCLVAAAWARGGAPESSSLFVSVALGAASAWVVSHLTMRWFADAVNPVTAVAEQMHEGDLSVRARVPRDQDVGELGAAFDKLASRFSRTMTELRSERDLVSRILNGMQEGVLLLDSEGRVALMNPALRDMLLLRADSVGQPLLYVVRHAELKELLDHARTTGTTCSGEVELGGLRPRRLLVRGTAFPEAGGLLAVFFDVTDVRRLESLRRDFVANVSHELRTPVTAVLSAAETLELTLGKDPAAAKRFLTIITRNASRLQRLIEDLLDLSRIESRELKLRPELLAVEPFAEHIVGLFRPRAEEKNISLTLDIEPHVELETDRRALEQVLTNLVDNAVKYCPEGSVVTVGARRDDDETVLWVADNGGGIDEAHLPRLFERFYRVDAGRSREMGGTGLGLSIVKHIVEALGGDIGVESKVGKGTKFELRIPDPPPPSIGADSLPPTSVQTEAS
ncbi:MAG: PAS domain-containing protein [Myxococcales bacterium]|nr:PAS domain-containing protein [Myxococcales bacterium]